MIEVKKNNYTKTREEKTPNSTKKIKTLRVSVITL
jgi:hypothetical protein